VDPSDSKEVTGMALEVDNAPVDVVDNTAAETIDEVSVDEKDSATVGEEDSAGKEDSAAADLEAPQGLLDEEKPLDKVVLYAFDEARQKLEQGSDVEPFTIIVSGENLYIESHPGEDIVECFNSARKTLFEMELLADAYVFCYDGYVQFDEGARDALIAERAEKTDEVGEAFALLYTIDEDGDGSIEFDELFYHLGEAPSLYGASEFDEDQFESFDDDELEDFEVETDTYEDTYEELPDVSVDDPVGNTDDNQPGSSDE